VSSLLKSIAETTTHRDRDGVQCAIVQMLADFLAADCVTIYQLVDHGGAPRLAKHAEAARRSAPLPLQSADDPCALHNLLNLPEWSRCVRQHRVVHYSSGPGMVTTLLPIAADRDALGLLVVKTRNRIRARDIEQTAAILRILNNHLALLDYGETDTLTGMLNRRTYEASFERLRQRSGAAAQESGSPEPSWLGMVDIDEFKHVNDTYGHLFGDEVLLLISKLMKQCFRGMDRLFRFGGEEFLVVLDHATSDGAEIAFDRLRMLVEAFVFPQVGRVTISLGYSQIRSTDTPISCVERADAALYYAKQHGRNKIRSYEGLICGGDLVPKSDGAHAELC
jgi:diguanylate cyclase (GGDEF)-like protein